MGDRVNPISVRSKRRITDALLELMQTTPFSKITVKEIVERAGLTRQTFYHNFESREDVLLYRLDELIEGFIEYLIAHKVGGWEDLICCFFRYWQEHEDFMQLLMKNDLTDLFSMRIPPFFEYVKLVHFDKTDLTDAEARLWYAFVSGAVVSTLTSWLTSSGGITARQLARMVVSMLDGSMMNRNEGASLPGAKAVVERMTSEQS